MTVHERARVRVCSVSLEDPNKATLHWLLKIATAVTCAAHQTCLVPFPGTGRTALPHRPERRFGHVTASGKRNLNEQDPCHFCFGRLRIYHLLFLFLSVMGNGDAADGSCSVILRPSQSMMNVSDKHESLFF